MNRFSVALCTFNGGPYLAAQLESIAGQSVLPDELVVCDDGSTDGTREILDRFAAASPFAVHVGVNDRRLGTTANFAQAIGRCTGDFIALCDQDDVWHPDKLARYREAFARAPRAGAVFCDAEAVDASLHPLGYTVWRYLRFTRAEQRRMRRGAAFDVLVRRHLVLGLTLAFRAAFRPLVLPIPSDWAHDIWTALIVAAVSDVLPLSAPLVRYRQHAVQQFGVPRLGWRRYIARTRNGSRAEYALHAHRHRAVYDRLAGTADWPVDGRRLAALSAKIAHLEVRAGLPAGRVQRLGAVLRELAARRYQRYAGGWAAAVRDLASPL